MWVRADNVFEAVVDPRYFYIAQGRIQERSYRISNEEMLERLKSLHERQGWLSGLIIDETENMPSSSAYQNRFGSLIRAYQMIGYTPDRDYRYIEINRHLRNLYPGIVEDTIHRIKGMGGQVRREIANDMLIINEELKISVVICRCFKTAGGGHRWRIHLDSGLFPDITIAIRMDHDNSQPLDYYLLPGLDIENPHISLADQNSFALEAYRFDDLEPFFLLTERCSLPEAA